MESKRDDLLKQSSQPALMLDLLNGDATAVRAAVATTFGPVVDESPKGRVAFALIDALLAGSTDTAALLEAHPIDYKSDYIFDITELTTALFLLEGAGNQPKLEESLAAVAKAVVIDAARHIQDNSNNYPVGSINAKIWLDGAGVRSWAQGLTEYFKRRNQLNSALLTAHARVRVTNSIMNHYPAMVGPDMVAVGDLSEQLSLPDQALRYYEAVISDFVEFLEEYEDEIREQSEAPASDDDGDDNGPLDDEAPFTLRALIDACLGRQRIAPAGNEEGLITRARALLKLIDQ